MEGKKKGKAVSNFSLLKHSGQKNNEGKNPLKKATSVRNLFLISTFYIEPKTGIIMRLHYFLLQV